MATARLIFHSGSILARYIRTSSSTVRIWPRLLFRSTFAACSHRQYSQSCWKCDHRLRCPVAFCPGCETIQPPPNDLHNDFAILGVPESYDISPEMISGRYRQLAKQLHPDHYETKSDQERAISRQYSTQINKAYRTLMDPVGRAQALLALRGVQVADGEQVSDLDFLEEIIELREKVQDAEPEELEKIRTRTIDDLVDHQNEFRQALAQDDLVLAKQALIKLIYRTRIMSAICKD